MHLPSPQNPLQPLDRRWLRAGYLAKQGQHSSPKYDDHLVTPATALQIRPIEPSLSLAEVLGGIELKPWRFASDDGGDRHPATPPAAAGDTAAGQRGGRRSGRRSGTIRKS
jgi:hypothetical protein